MTQYSCNDDYVACQQGCFQYHTGITGTRRRVVTITITNVISGTIQSYNFAGSQQLAGQNYKNCIRQEEGYCCIQYSVISYNMGAGNIINLCTIGGIDGANRCSGASICSMDMIIIPGAGQSPTGNPGTTGENYERFNYFIFSFKTLFYNSRFCGLNLNALGFPAVNSPIISCECPFELDHITGIEALNGVAFSSLSAAATPIVPQGFQLSYSQIAGSC